MGGTPAIRIRVWFLRPDEGGRRIPARDSLTYRPHLVVGDPRQRAATYGPEGACSEHYLGIGFTGDGSEFAPGEPYDVEVHLIYFEQVDYSALAPDAAFTVREGGSVVGYGEVLESPFGG